jgi:nitrite reductase (NO-forming)
LTARRTPAKAAVGLAAAAGLLLGACGGGGGGGASDTKASGVEPKMTPDAAGGGSKIEVTAKNLRFDPDALTAKAGQAVTIVLKNDDSIEHDLTVSDAAFKVVAPASRSGEKVLTVPKPGTYEFHCSVPGHEAAGMKGHITVE